MRNVIMSDAVTEYSATDMTTPAGGDVPVVVATPAAVPVAPVVPAAPADPIADDPAVREVEVKTTTETVTTPAPETTAEVVADNVPMAQTMRARSAIFEAFLSQMVEDAANPKDDEEPASKEEATEQVSEAVDKAVEADVVPPTFRRRIPHIINRYYKRTDPRVALYAKAARYTAAVLTEVRDDAITLDPVIDDEVKKGTGITDIEKGEGELTFTNNAKHASTNMWIPGFGFGFGSRMENSGTIPASADEIDIEPILPSDHGKENIGENIDDTTLEHEGSNPTSEGGPSMHAPWFFSDATDQAASGAEGKKDDDDDSGDGPISEKVEEAVVDPEKDVSSDDVGNKAVADTMRVLSAAAITERKFTAYLSRNYTNALVRQMGHELRYCMPAKFVRRYGLK